MWYLFDVPATRAKIELRTPIFLGGSSAWESSRPLPKNSDTEKTVTVTAIYRMNKPHRLGRYTATIITKKGYFRRFRIKYPRHSENEEAKNCHLYRSMLHLPAYIPKHAYRNMPIEPCLSNHAYRNTPIETCLSKHAYRNMHIYRYMLIETCL